MPHSSADAQAKLDRGLEHLGALYAAVQRFIDKGPCGLVTYCEMDSKQHVVVVEAFERPPNQVGILIGDCVHNFRTALDYLAYRLSIALTGCDPPPNEKTSGFPIHQGEAGLKSGLKAKIGKDATSIDKGLYAVLESLQPYHGGDTQLLRTLLLLDNFDKHRLPPVHAAVGTILSAHIRTIDGLATVPTVRPGPIEDRTEVFRYAHDAEVDVEFDFAADVAFAQGEPGNGGFVLQTLMDIRKFIRDEVFPALEPYL